MASERIWAVEQVFIGSTINGNDERFEFDCAWASLTVAEDYCRNTFADESCYRIVAYVPEQPKAKAKRSRK